MVVLETKLPSSEGRLKEGWEKISIPGGCLFLLDKIKHDKSAILFYTGLQNYEALISFFECIKQRFFKESQSH